MLTLETYSFDTIKFWFLLIFIYDYIENTKNRHGGIAF